MVGDRDVLLHLVEFLRQIVRRRILAAVDHAGLQRLIDFRERHDLRDRADVAEIAVGDLGAGDADLEPLEIGRHQQRTVGRGHVEAVVPIGETGDALGLQLLEQPLADRPLHGLGVGRLILEQPRQIERLELLGAERGEFRGRGREHLHRAELQRLDLFLVLVERGVRVDFDLDLAVGVLLGELLELQRALALRRVVGDDVAELDDDRVVGQGGARSHREWRPQCRARINLRMNSPPQLTHKPVFLGFPVFTSGSKPLFEQLDLSRIGKARHRGRTAAV